MTFAQTLSTLSLLLLAAPAMAQHTDQPKPYTPKNTIYLELGGVGHWYSLNYQRNFSICKRFEVTAGVSVNPFRVRNDDYFHYYGHNKFTPTGALTIQGIYKFGRNEIALGGAFGYYTYYDTDYGYTTGAVLPKLVGSTMVFSSLGYGHTFGEHIYTGAYFWLHIASHGYTEIIPWGGARIGYKFGK